MHRRSNRSRMACRLHETEVLANRDRVTVHPKAVELNDVRIKFAGPVLSTNLCPPAVVPTMDGPESPEIVPSAAHHEGAPRNPYEIRSVHRVIARDHNA